MSEDDEQTELHDCGYPDNSFACKIRHQTISMPNSEAKRHDKYLRDVRQDQVYGL